MASTVKLDALTAEFAGGTLTKQKKALIAALAENSEVKKGVISKALSILTSVQTREAQAFVQTYLMQHLLNKTRQKMATKAGKRENFGKVVMVKAKRAKTTVKA